MFFMFEFQFICFALVLAILAIVKCSQDQIHEFWPFANCKCVFVNFFTEIFGEHGKKTLQPCHLQFIHEYRVSFKL
jgi:hypothetical protein